MQRVFNLAAGTNFTIRNGSAASVDTVLGLNAQAGTVSTDGARAQLGDEVFVDSTNRQDILTTLARFSSAMRNFDGSQATRDQLESVVGATIENLGNAQTSVLEVTSRIGARVTTLESIEQLHFDSEIVAQELLSQIRDVDYAEASTRLAAQSLILQAAQSSFIRVSRLSLFEQL